tara:strand:+ start:333 stop:512 length:180 start_codon:yes stop_codon:yes gene_type:complete
VTVVYERLDLRRRNDKKIARIVEELMRHETRNLRRYMLPEKEYAGMARQVVKGHLKKLT